MNVKKLLNYVKLISVEPIGFFNFLAFNIFIITLPTGLYDVVCYQKFHEGSAYCRSHDDVDVVVQQLTAEWNILFGLVHFLPAVLAHIMLGSWSDRSGRKINILIGLAGLLINVFPLTVIFTFRNTSLWYLVLSSFISGATGYIGIINTSSFAYLSDVTENRKHLTVRMVNYAIAMSVAAIIGSALAATFLKSITFPYIVVFVECTLTIAFFYGLIRLRQISPVKLKLLRSGIVPNASESNEAEKTNCRAQITEVWNSSKVLLKSVWLTYTKQRDGHRKAYIILVAVIYFLHIFSEMGLRGQVTTLYVFRRPLGWDGSKFAIWKMVHSILLFLGNIIGALVFKKLLKFKESTILLMCLASTFGELVITGLAQYTWMMYLAAGVGMFSNLLVPTVKAFTSLLVDQDEVGKSYIAFGLAADFGYGVSNMLANAIYASTVKIFAGFIFLFGAFLITIAFLMMLLIHVSFLRELKQEHFTGGQLKNTANQADDDTGTTITHL